jgi:hypothetical protein
MPLADRDIIITPNRGQSSEPNIAFRGADASNSATVTLRVYNSSTVGSISFEGNAGQLMSVVDSLSGTIFSVNDISGMPSIEVLDTGEIRLAQYSGGVNIAGITTVTNTTNASSTLTGALQVRGGAGIGGNLYVGGTIFGLASISGTITTATNLAGGALGRIPYQTAAGATQFISTGTTGSILQMGANTATFVTTGSIYVGRAVFADNASTASQVATLAQTANATYFLTFVDANNATAVVESVYTTSSFTVNAASGGVRIGGVTTITNTTAATSTITGAFQVVGGVGIGGNLYAGLDGYFNATRVGRGAGSVASNTVLGNGALDSNSTGTHNTSIGNSSLNSNTTGQFNTAVGSGANSVSSTGQYNITIGYNSGNSITTGTNNTIIGSVSGTAGMTGTVIVAAGTVERFRITSVGNMGIGTTTPSALLDVNGTVGVRSATNATSTNTGALQVTGGAGIGSDLWVGGTAYATVLQSTSDVNFKKDITTITNALNTVLQMRGVEYKWTHNSEPGLGLIAQEVQPLVPAAVSETGDRLTVGYGNLVGLLVEAIKEQQQQILALQQEIRDLKR